MKSWNNAGKLKALILVFAALINLVAPLREQPQLSPIILILSPLLFAIFAVPVLSNSVGNREFVRPTWNDIPLKLKRPLSFIHFGAIFFITVGLSVIIGSGIKYKISLTGLTSVSLGLGLLLGIQLTLLLSKKQEISKY